MTRSALDALRGRKPSAGSAAEELITSVTLEIPEEFQRMSMSDIQEKSDS